MIRKSKTFVVSNVCTYTSINKIVETRVGATSVAKIRIYLFFLTYLHNNAQFAGIVICNTYYYPPIL